MVWVQLGEISRSGKLMAFSLLSWLSSNRKGKLLLIFFISTVLLKSVSLSLYQLIATPRRARHSPQGIQLHLKWELQAFWCWSQLFEAICSLAAVLLYPNSICQSPGESRRWARRCETASSSGRRGNSTSREKKNKKIRESEAVSTGNNAPCLMKAGAAEIFCLKMWAADLGETSCVLCSKACLGCLLQSCAFLLSLKARKFPLSSPVQSLLEWLECSNSSSKSFSLQFSMG